MPLKTKPENQLVSKELVVYVYLFNQLTEVALFWFCFNCVNFRHILFLKYLALNNLNPKSFAWKYTVTLVTRIYS